jgi:ATP-dependent Lon protease
MTDIIQNNVTKKENVTKNDDVIILVEKKIDFFKDVIQKTILHVQKNKGLDILGVSDVGACIDRLSEINKKIQELIEINNVKTNTDTLINNLQIINNELSSLFKTFGTENLEDLLLICFGNNNKITQTELDNSKFDLLKKYFHPTSYKIINKKDDTNKTNKKKSNDDNIDEKTNNLECFDIFNSSKEFYMKVYGIKIYVYNNFLKKGLIIYGIVDDVIISFLKNKYILSIKKDVSANLSSSGFNEENMEYFMASLILKDYLVHNTYTGLFNKFAGYSSQNNSLKQKQISQIVKEFISDDLFSKRNTLIQLLIKSSQYENQYFAYLLYDVLSNDTNGNVDTKEQTILFDSLPLLIKQYFRNAMKKTVQYTNDLSNFDINKIPLEQQICLLKASDVVKEKAMMKLKEVKAKSEDSGSKARQYLDGLLKIPFNIYKREPILNLMDTIRFCFKELYKKYEINKLLPIIPIKEKYTSIEIVKYIKQIKNKISCNIYDSNYINKMKDIITNGDKTLLIANIMKINDTLNINKISNRIKYSNKKKNELKIEIENFIDFCNNNNKELLPVIDKLFINLKLVCSSPKAPANSSNILKDIDLIDNNLNDIGDYMSKIKESLNNSVYGHEKAKKQIERIIGQWITGEQGGYCFGFEGPPGVGKTSLAKVGLSNILKDENGVSRPFAMIQMGGDSNGSTLHGHNYTYVGSTWGSIVQILIDKKCMNPIIFIDEIDKISKTEHGKEIVGILTHLLDPAQNDCFQDKYFSGIDIDLSKALFILSYNDADIIDKILLDRVHRVKFDSLSSEDKIIISNKHILPEIYKKVGLEEMIFFSDETIKFIIEEYTSESGVRKLKEVLFEIISEINLNVLKNNEVEYDFPLVISIDDIKNKYFKDKRETKVHKIHTESKVGIINALWANSYGAGGVLPLQASFIPSNKFLDLILTGSMGDVMKESISVSLTNAWNLTSLERQRHLIEKYNDTKNNNVCGIHIHCPDISTKKDGPSATTAFTILIYSLFNDIKIKNNFGITGETHFGFFLTEIGGLQEKIIHSIKAGITEFIFPKENQSDFNKIMEKYKDNNIIKGIKFHSISHIDEVLDLILEK